MELTNVYKNHQRIDQDGVSAVSYSAFISCPGRDKTEAPTLAGTRRLAALRRALPEFSEETWHGTLVTGETFQDTPHAPWEGRNSYLLRRNTQEYKTTKAFPDRSIGITITDTSRNTLCVDVSVFSRERKITPDEESLAGTLVDRIASQYLRILRHTHRPAQHTTYQRTA